MGFSMFSSHVTPIAVDFGSSSVKLLQCSLGEKPQVVASASVEIPDDARSGDRRIAFLQSELPGALKSGGFKGKKAVCSPPNASSLVQHLQVPPSEGNREEAIKTQLELQLRCPTAGAVVRWTDVCDIQRDGQMRQEVICFAIHRSEVMKHVELLRKCKLDVVGFHAEIHSILWAFDHIHRRADDDKITTLYVDLGWCGTKVAISHGKRLMFAKYNQLGGRHFDQLIMEKLKCDAATARIYRQSHDPVPAAAMGRGDAVTDAPAMLRAGMAKASKAEAKAGASLLDERRVGAAPAVLQTSVEPGEGVTSVATVDLSELIDTISDDLCSCLRYHRSLFPGRNVDRAIFVGGEARHAGLCQRIAQSLRMPAQLGDPLARFGGLPGNEKNQAQPGWAVACGLCSAPTAM
jgi:Tfp pilus assembly PilM family ATPase